MASPNRVRVRVEDAWDGAGLRITLATPAPNVLDARAMDAIAAALDGPARAAGRKIVVFAADGEHFSYGASVAEHRRAFVAAMLARFRGLFERLIDLAVPTAAVVRGRCLGGGLELVSFCSFVFAHDDARFGQPEIRLGVFPPPASILLPLRCGQSFADDLVLTGREVNAREAAAHGLVTATGDDPDALLDAFVRAHLLPKSASSLRHAVRAVRCGMHEALRAGLVALERAYVDDLMATHDANEGIAAFLEKREPVWRDA